MENVKGGIDSGFEFVAGNKKCLTRESSFFFILLVLHVTITLLFIQ